MRFYETVFIVRQDLTTAQVEVLVNQYTKIVRDHGGDVSKTEFCGLRSLAYPIKKNKKGHYILMNVTCTNEGVREMERQMKINEDILRYVSIRVEKLDNNPSPMMQQRSYRDDYKGASEDDYDDEVLTA